MERQDANGQTTRLAPRSDRYQVVERLGEGGMAIVFRAVDNQERRWCALKVLLPDYRNNPTVRKRFTAEAEVLSTLRHRNLVEVWDIQVAGAEPFFAMELATGGSVIDWVNLYGPMPPRMAVDVAIQICKALRVAHDKGIVHRDVKPHNILVNRRGVCKLADFGIARHDDITGLTMDGSAMGTLGFIAPEQKDDASDVDHRADIYSVGATLHTLVSGKTSMNLYIADQEPEMMESVPEQLFAAIIKSTRYRPDERYQSMEELAKALFDARTLLPDDPPDTPSLVTGDASVYEGALHRFMPSLQPEPLVLADNEATSSTPSISRELLLRSLDETPREAARVGRPRLRLNRQALLLGSLPLWALLLVLGGLTGVRATEMNGTVRAVLEQRTAIDQVLDTEKEIVKELTALGAPASAVTSAWTDARSTQGPEKTQRIEVFLALASQLVAENEPIPGAPLVHHARAVEQRVRRIQNQLNLLQDAERFDAYVRSTALSRIAVAIGIGPDPP